METDDTYEIVGVRSEETFSEKRYIAETALDLAWDWKADGLTNVRIRDADGNWRDPESFRRSTSDVSIGYAVVRGVVVRLSVEQRHDGVREPPRSLLG